jgi:hypothetical protein
VWLVVAVACGGLVGSEGVDEAEERWEPLVVGEDAPADAAAGGDDLAGDLDEGGEEGAEVHGEQAAAWTYLGSTESRW